MWNNTGLRTYFRNGDPWGTLVKYLSLHEVGLWEWVLLDSMCFFSTSHPDHSLSGDKHARCPLPSLCLEVPPGMYRILQISL